MNFIFFSAHFPQYGEEFCKYLKEAGVNVLAIGDEPYEKLSKKLKKSLTEYYKVDEMEDYEDVLKGVAYLTFKHGKIDRFESLNEHWLTLEARIREDFNISGVKTDFIANINHKSKMKAFFEKAGVNYIKYAAFNRGEDLESFIHQAGYPVVVKPDHGSGASMTYKLFNDDQLKSFLEEKPEGVNFIVEQFVDGIILTYDGIVDGYGNILFENSFRVEQSIMDIVNNKDHVFYYGIPHINEKVAEAGRKIVHAFELKEKFFHIEFFERKSDKEIIVLELNMRPPGALMTDTMNYTHDINVYKEWGYMVAGKGNKVSPDGAHYAAYASRRNDKEYAHTHEEIVNKYKNNILHSRPIEKIFSGAMGDYAYLFRSDSFEETETIKNFIHQEK